jgi:hypothetical protein
MATTLPVWPVNLPQPDRDGYGYELAFGLLRTQMQGGTVRQRRSVFNMRGTFSMSFRMNTAQLGILQVFLDKFGYGWFAMDLVSGAARVWRVKSDCLLHRVRFISDPSHAMIGPNLWRVTLAAEVEAMSDPRADTAVGDFTLVDDVTPEFVDELVDWDTLKL